MCKESSLEKLQIGVQQKYLCSRQECRQLKQRYLQLEQRCLQLEEETRMLRERLNTNSKNSSKPPSQDPHRKSRQSNPTGKKSGGQPGHRGHKRKYYPKEEVKETIELFPEICPHCNGKHFGTDSSVELQQVIELPQISPEVTQYYIHTTKCLKCGESVRANVPKEARRSFGPRLMGFLTMLVAEGHLSKRKICAIAKHLGVRISLGSVCNIHRLAATLLEKPAQIIRDYVLECGKVNADETSWRVLKEKHWAWIGVTSKATFLKIDPSRSTQAYLRIFGAFKGILTTDRYGAYNCHTGRRQSCLAHIDRSFAKMSQRAGIDQFCGKMLQEQLDQIFKLWSVFKKGEISRLELQTKSTDPIENIKALLILTGRKAKERQSQALANDLLKRFDTLWTFLHEEGVEPTNNLAERGLRSLVIFRKLSQGNQSDWGAKIVK